ncbi:MAG: hypothetical protein MUF34_20625 [Polyangiaceae bacterium]|jgi:hypothetical protein|nr:hypothetical protein [Polyangiaceae bacterium]
MIFFGSRRTGPRPRAIAAFAPFASFVALTAFAAPARAEISSWLSAGVGASSFSGSDRSGALRFTLPIDIGLGSPPSGPIVVGAGARALPYFGDGLAVAGYARVATQSYVVGGWGAALDAGGFTRLSGDGGPGFLASLNLGVPWGFIATGSYGRAEGGESVVSCTLGIDFLRLTVYRLGGETTWPNPKPAWRPEAPESAPPAR